MKIGIPLFGTRISPRFDCSQTFLVIEVEDGQNIQKQIVFVCESSPIKRIRNLAALHIDTLICGGIDAFSERQLYFHGIRVFSWITGEAEAVLCCFLEGKLESGMMMGADGRCCGRWRFRRGSRHL
ncbi:MAG: NifB/NifX family molybdenum-iron cluster-binding protein [bacterium]